MTRYRHLCTALAAAGALTLAAHAPAAMLGDSWDFGTDTGKDDLSDFTVNGGADVGLTADAATFKKDGDLGNRSIQTTVAELAASGKENFTITTSYAPNHEAANNFDRFGIVMFSEALTSHTTGIAAVLLNGSDSNIDLVFRTGIAGSSIVSKADWVTRAALNGNAPVDLTVVGTYSGNDLMLDFTASFFDGTNIVSENLQHTVTNVAFTGTGFGVGGRIGGDNVWSVDTLAIVPEPASLALMGLGGLLMLGHQRKP